MIDKATCLIVSFTLLLQVNDWIRIWDPGLAVPDPGSIEGIAKVREPSPVPTEFAGIDLADTSLASRTGKAGVGRKGRGQCNVESTTQAKGTKIAGGVSPTVAGSTRRARMCRSTSSTLELMHSLTTSHNTIILHYRTMLSYFATFTSAAVESSNKYCRLPKGKCHVSSANKRTPTCEWNTNTKAIVG
jgi:hypothetical protein